MLSFEEFIIDNRLDEKLIMFNQGKKNGQIVFMAGGAGSGKGFSLSNFMESNKFKIRDVDAWKGALLKIDELKGKYPEIRGLNLKEPDDVAKLHQFVKDLGIKQKTLDLLLRDMRKDRLPNIIFDITLKDMEDITSVIPQLLSAGYEPRNIHLVWVLAKYEVAIANNRGRDRVVDERIVLQTHEGAAKTMTKIIKGNIPYGLDGAIHVILSDPEKNIYFTNQDTQSSIRSGTQLKGEKIGKGGKVSPYLVYEKGTNKFVMKYISKEGAENFIKKNPDKYEIRRGARTSIMTFKDFPSFQLKREGKKPTTENDVLDQLKTAIYDMAPKTRKLRKDFRDIGL